MYELFRKLDMSHTSSDVFPASQHAVLPTHHLVVFSTGYGHIHLEEPSTYCRRWIGRLLGVLAGPPPEALAGPPAEVVVRS